MMTILASVQEANTNTNLPDLVFAPINEFARFIDSFKATNTPIHIVTPFEEQGVWDGARRKAIVPIEGWILTLVQGEPLDLRSPKAEELYISPMRLLAKKFLRQLINTDIVDDEVKQIRDTIVAEYGFLTEQLIGVHYRIQLPIAEGVC